MMMDAHRRSLGSLNSLAEDSLSTFNDTLTIYGHPKVRDVIRAFEQLQAVQVLHYRTALKLRCIQKKMELHRIDTRDVLTVFSNHGMPPSNEEIGESEMEPIIADICLMMDRHQSLDTTTVSCTDLVLTWLLQMFDRNYAGQITVRSFTLALVVISGGRLLDKFKYIYDLAKGPDGLLDQESFRMIMCDVLMIPSSVFEEEHYGSPNVIFGAQYECFNQLACERERISIDEFLCWASASGAAFSWLQALHRLSASEYTVNLTSCTVCNAAPHLGFRYVGLYSYNLHLCQECAWIGHTEGDVELREFGAIGTGVNLSVVPSNNNSGSCLSLSGSHPLQDVYTRLDPEYDTLLSYSKRLAPQSASNFLALGHITKDHDVDDAMDALIYECDERGAKLDRDFALLCKEYGEINRLERKKCLNKLELLQVWKKRDDLMFRMCVWMGRRNSLFIKEEGVLEDLGIELPLLKYTKSNGMGSAMSLVSNSSIGSSKRDSSIIMNSLSYKVPTDEAVMVMSKLTMIVNNALLQKSMSQSPQIKRVVTNSGSPSILKSPPQYSMDNGVGCNGASAVSETNTRPSTLSTTPPLDTPPLLDSTNNGNVNGIAEGTGSEAAMKEFDNVMEDIIQDTFSSGNLDSPLFDRKEGPPDHPAPDPVRKPPIPGPKHPTPGPKPSSKPSSQPAQTPSPDPVEEPEETQDLDCDNYEEGDYWETDEEGQWETEDEITVMTEHHSPGDPPSDLSLNSSQISTIAPLPSDIQINVNSGSDDPLGNVSEPECNPPPRIPPRSAEGAPVPPPRSLMSPVGRRATSLKTKEGMPLDVKKAIRTSSNAAELRKNGASPLGSGIPQPLLTKKPIPTPSPSGKVPIPAPSSRTSTPSDTPSNTPSNTPSKAPLSASSTPENRGAVRSIKKPTPLKSRGPPQQQRGPIVYEGSSDSETSSSSSSDSSDWGEKKGKFTRFRSARFHRSKVPTPNRATSSFKQKRSVKPPAELGFSNKFAE